MQFLYATKMPPNSIWCNIVGGIFWHQKPHNCGLAYPYMPPTKDLWHSTTLVGGF